MPETGLKTCRQKKDVWKACERTAASWLEYLASVPQNQALTDRHWFEGWRKFVIAKANEKPSKL